MISSDKPIFSQVINLLDRNAISSRSKEYGSDHYCKRFDTLITMLYGVLSSCTSLRELCTGIVSYGDKRSPIANLMTPLDAALLQMPTSGVAVLFLIPYILISLTNTFFFYRTAISH